MADDVAMTVRFGSEEPLMEFPAERLTVSVPVTSMNSRLYRLDGVPIFVESASFGDVIEAEPVGADRCGSSVSRNRVDVELLITFCRNRRLMASGGNTCSRS